MGDPVCTLAAFGQPDPSLVPAGVDVAVGEAEGYWCLIW